MAAGVQGGGRGRNAGRRWPLASGNGSCGVDGALSRVKVVDPSYFNWPAVVVALADTIVPEVPPTNQSVNLSCAGHDL